MNKLNRQELEKIKNQLLDIQDSQQAQDLQDGADYLQQAADDLNTVISDIEDATGGQI